MCVCLSVCLCMCLSIYLCVCVCVRLSVCVCLYVCLYVCLSVYLSSFLSTISVKKSSTSSIHSNDLGRGQGKGQEVGSSQEFLFDPFCDYDSMTDIVRAFPLSKMKDSSDIDQEEKWKVRSGQEQGSVEGSVLRPSKENFLSSAISDITSELLIVLKTLRNRYVPIIM